VSVSQPTRPSLADCTCRRAIPFSDLVTRDVNKARNDLRVRPRSRAEMSHEL